MSDKPLADRLQVKPGRRLAAVGAPPTLDAMLGAADCRAGPDEAEVVLLAVRHRADLQARLPPLLAALRPCAIFWLAYPKLTSPLAADLDRDLIRQELAPAHGLDPVAQIALDADWTALRLKRVAA